MSLGASPPSDDPAASAPPGDGRGEFVPARYDGAWLGAVVPHLLSGRAPAGLPAWAGVATPLVILLIDGLGWRMYRHFADRLDGMAGMEGDAVTSVVPSTTATALPSLTTGRTPAEHGMFGDRIRVGGTVLSVLQWTVPEGTAPDPAAVQPHAPFGGRRVLVVSNAKFAGSGFSRAHLRGTEFRGYTDADGLVTQVASGLRDGAPVIFAYLPDVDRTAHEFGLDGELFLASLETADRVVRDLRRLLPDSGALVVTADHGHVTADPEQRVDVTPLAPMVAATAGSARLRYLHARPGAVDDLVAAASELAGARAWVMRREDLVASGWLGPEVSPLLQGRLGDVVMVARDAATMVDPAEGRINSLVTVHGSLSPDEMLVPLLAVRGEGSGRVPG